MWLRIHVCNCYSNNTHTHQALTLTKSNPCSCPCSSYYSSCSSSLWNGSSVTHRFTFARVGCHNCPSLLQLLLPQAPIRSSIHRQTQFRCQSQSQSQTYLQTPSQEASLQTPFFRQGSFQILTSFHFPVVLALVLKMWFLLWV